METNFLQTVIDEFRSDLSTKELALKELALLSNRLLIVAAAADNQKLTLEAKKVIIHELRIIRGEYINSDYNLKWEALRLISQMETNLGK